MKFSKCYECQGNVTLVMAKGRTRELRKGVHVPIPNDYLLPTCIKCGEEYAIPEINEALDALLERTFIITDQGYFYRGVTT